MESRTLSLPVLAALWVLGMALIAAAFYYGFWFLIGLAVELSEPTQPTAMQWNLIWSYVLAGSLLFATGVFCLLCWTRRRLWVLGGLVVATAAAIGLCFHLYPKAERSACERFIAKQRAYGPNAPVDTSCLADN
ncbi:MAG TPA: hypothetical protein VE053_05120 [Allosphingosinicella sp.]|nr:hypothetical protein [Allosphingosinicella sp.]